MGLPKGASKELSHSDKKRLKAIASKIKKIRKQQGHTSYENFAFDTGIPRMAVYRIEKGESDIHFTTLTKVLDALEVELCEFFEDIK